MNRCPNRLKCVLGVHTSELVKVNKYVKMAFCKYCGKVLEENVLLKEHAARVSNTPVKVLRKLVKDENWGVRHSLSYNKKTPKDVLEQLAEDEDEYIRVGVVSHENTPIEVLKKLSKDENLWVRKIARKNFLLRLEKIDKDE